MQKMAVAGGYDCDFVDPVPDELTCPVCLFPCRSPHVLSCCGVKICENCVGPIEASCNPVCPTCRERFTHFLEKDVDRQILGRNVRCSRNADGCEWIGQLRHLDKHVRDECKWTPVQCRLAGCSVSIPRHQIAVHEQEECPRRPMEVKFEIFTRKMEEQYGKEIAELRAEYGKEMSELREEYGKEKAELREKYDILQQRVLDLEVAQTLSGSKFKQPFSADMALIGVTIAASVLLALLIYVSTGSLLKNDSFRSLEFFLFDQPLKMLLSQPLYILHQMAHWAMLYYARTRLKCSHKLQPFHYWMAGMNLVYVLLYISKPYLFPDNSSYRLSWELPLIVLGLSYWFLIAKSSGRGLIFGYSIPYSQGIAEVAETCLPYYFSFAVLLNFWYKPFVDIYGYFFVRLIVELIFITHSCLIQTHFHENKYWTLLLELMVLPYVTMTLMFPTEPESHLQLLILLLSLTCAVVFAISQMHGISFLTRKIKMVTTVLLISHVIIVFELWNPLPNAEPRTALCFFIGYYYIGLIVIMVVLMVIKYMIKTIIKKKNDFYLHKKNKNLS